MKLATKQQLNISNANRRKNLKSIPINVVFAVSRKNPIIKPEQNIYPSDEQNEVPNETTLYGNKQTAIAKFNTCKHTYNAKLLRRYMHDPIHQKKAL